MHAQNSIQNGRAPVRSHKTQKSQMMSHSTRAFVPSNLSPHKHTHTHTHAHTHTRAKEYDVSALDSEVNEYVHVSEKELKELPIMKWFSGTLLSFSLTHTHTCTHSLTHTPAHAAT